LLGGADALVFTDDIGVQLPAVRAQACEGLEWCGITLDVVANAAAPAGQVAEISATDSRTRIFFSPHRRRAGNCRGRLEAFERGRYASL